MIQLKTPKGDASAT